MLKSTLVLNPVIWACCVALLVPLAAGADLETRKERSFRNPIESRIVRIEVDAGHLFITGENLPEGSGVKVRLGSESLGVIRSSPSLVVATLPSTRPKRVDELIVERGVHRAVARGRALDWGLRWVPSSREANGERAGFVGLFTTPDADDDAE